MTQEVLSQDSRETHADIRDSISSNREHFRLEVLLKKFLFVHSFAAHHGKDLSPLKGVGLKEFSFDNLHYGLLLFEVRVKLFKDVYQTGGSCSTDLNDLLITESKEHGQELIVNSVRIKKLSKSPEVLGKDQFHAPFVLRFCHAILILYVLEELMTVLRFYFLQENVKIAKGAHSNFI